MRLINTSPTQSYTTKLLVSRVQHTHDLQRESQQCNDRTKLPVEMSACIIENAKNDEIEDGISKLILDSNIENVNWIYLGVFVSIEKLKKLLIS